MQLQQYLNNVAASLLEAISDLTTDPGAATPMTITRWLRDFQGEADMILEFELPALKCYDC